MFQLLNVVGHRYLKCMFEEKLFTSNRGASFKSDAELHEHDFQSEHGALQMETFMDYCYFIEKLWLDWKQYYLHFFTLNEEHKPIQD
jgi:hypothetical protein